MALKADRLEITTDISYFMNETATRGGIVVISTAGSGAAMDQAAALVTYAATQSGKVPVGLLLNDMVDNDLTKVHGNWHKNEMQKGNKVTLLQEGWVVTNMIYPGMTPVAGGPAFLGPSGLLQTSISDGGLAKSPVVGRFLSTKDEDGYVKLYVKLPPTSQY